MKNILRLTVTLLMALSCHGEGCPFAYQPSGKMHPELFHELVREEGKSLDPKTFTTSICKLPNPKGFSREELDQYAVQQGCLAPFNSLAANILRSSKADSESLEIIKKSLREIDLYRLRLTEKGKKANPITEEEKKERVCKVKRAKCDKKAKYRTYDGECNNLKHTSYGQSRTAFVRFLPPDYSDGLSEPRIAKDGSQLTSPRQVSATIVQEITREFPDITVLFTSFGQFVAHDTTLAVSFRPDSNLTFDCCVAAEKNLFPSECLPIEVSRDDPFYGSLNVTCLSNMRTGPAPHDYCQGDKPVRQQLTQINSFIDASVVYGADKKTAVSLRTLSGGRLVTTPGKKKNREFPRHFSSAECEEDPKTGKICVQVGDIRGEEQPLITTLQIVFVRFHNYVCEQLMKVNKDWNDETLYQESRKIVGAIFQRIVYGEFLPILLGDRIVETFGLNLGSDDFVDTYDEETNPSTFNEYGAAAFRYGHATIPGLIKIATDSRDYKTQRLSEHFITNFDTSLVDQYINGFVNQRGELVDSGLSKELTNNLFKKDNPFGHDLAAININRGRDHGLPGYPAYRKFCGLSKVKSFKDLDKIMKDPAVADLFEAVYNSVDDIDLWVAGISEAPLFGAIIGPTFACIIAKQFEVMKKGDRFWHELGGQPQSFSKAQLNEIRKISIAGIFCQVSDVKNMQLLAMRKPNDKSNRIYPCSGKKFPKMDFSKWAASSKNNN